MQGAGIKQILMARKTTNNDNDDWQTPPLPPPPPLQQTRGGEEYIKGEKKRLLLSAPCHMPSCLRTRSHANAYLPFLYQIPSDIREEEGEAEAVYITPRIALTVLPRCQRCTLHDVALGAASGVGV